MKIQDLIIKYKDEIEEIKLLINNETIADSNIAVAIDKAYKAINKYVGWDTFNSEYIVALYTLAITYLSNDNIKYKSTNNERVVTQKSEGSRSVTYAKAFIDIDNIGLTEDVKAMLPMPKLRCL